MSLRVRLTLLVTAVAALVAALGAYAFVSAFSAALVGNVDSQLALQVNHVARGLPPPSPAVRASALPGEFLVQVVDPTGVVRKASSDAGEAPLLPPALLAAARKRQLAVTTRDEEETLRTVAAPLAGRPGWVALASVSLAPSERTQANLTHELVIGGVVLLACVAAGAYVLAGAALAPVERLRRQAARLAADNEPGDLAVPPTGDELARLAATLNELLARLRGALARQRRLVADASHELRTPLAILLAELELAAQPGRRPEELRAALASVTTEAKRLNRLTNDLLLLARRDAERLSIDRRPTPIGPLLAASASRLARRAPAVRIVTTPPAEDRWSVAVDPDRLRQAVDNLLDNALRVAPDGSDVSVTAHEVHGLLIISVADEGPGFPPEFLARAFEPFARPDGGRARAVGSAGLGLAIVAAIAQAHGGHASAENRPGGGAVVRLDLPLPAPPTHGGTPPLDTGPPPASTAGLS